MVTFRLIFKVDWSYDRGNRGLLRGPVQDLIWDVRAGSVLPHCVRCSVDHNVLLAAELPPVYSDRWHTAHHDVCK